MNMPRTLQMPTKSRVSFDKQQQQQQQKPNETPLQMLDPCHGRDTLSSVVSVLAIVIQCSLRSFPRYAKKNVTVILNQKVMIGVRKTV